jgi:hypothetical protein
VCLQGFGTALWEEALEHLQSGGVIHRRVSRMKFRVEDLVSGALRSAVSAIGICASSVRFELGQMFFRPMTNGFERLDQCSAQRSERVFHFWRNDRMHFALDEAVPLETAQSLGEHFLRDAADLALERGVSPRPAGEDMND